MEPSEHPPSSAPVDRGLDSIADLHALMRLLFFGLVAVVIVGTIITILAHKWSVLLLLLGAYAVIATVQWVAVRHRLAGKRNPH